MTTLVIAVLTFRRPGDLSAALPLLADQAGGRSDADLAVDLLVVDNDPAGSGRALVTGFASTCPVPVRYVVEPTPGIAAARNRALDEARDRDLLVFVDDDERPTARWLDSLVTTYRTSGSAAVVGPVISEFAAEPDAWIAAGRFFARRRMPTGSAVEVAATNNLLLDLHQVRALGLRFDLTFGIAGGEDTLFTRALHQAGASMTWCDEAVVVDVVPPARLTRRWVVSRAFSSGNSWSLTSVALSRSARERLHARLGSAAHGLARLVGGGARYAFGVLRRSMAARARGTRTAARGLGMLSGAGGYRYREYRRR